MLNRKRAHQEDAAAPQRLSVLEFCSVLNSSNSSNSNPYDSQELLQTLQRFALVIRSERRVAIPSALDDDEVDDDNDHDATENIKEEIPTETANVIDEEGAKSTKRLKKDESWKEDTKSYQVPFVGTSQITNRQQDYGKVVEHTWPCGLLQAYLIKSPMLRELLVFESSTTSSPLNNNFLPRHILRRIPPHSKTTDKKKQHLAGWWESQLVKAYLQALNEVLTAILPLSDKHLTTTSSDQMHQRLITLFQNHVIPTVWHVLEQQQPSNVSSNNTHKSPPSLVPVAMQILVRFASVSVTTARLVAHHLATSTKSQVQSSWFSLPVAHDDDVSTKPPPQQDPRTPLQPTNESTPIEPTKLQQDEQINKDKVKKKQDRLNSTKSAHYTCRSAIQLVAILLEWQDTSTLATIMSAGAKERKLPPGLLHIVLRASRLWKGVVSSAGNACSAWHSKVDAALGRLLRALRALLERGVLRRRQRLWLELWSGSEAWQNLIQLAALTPVALWTDDQEKVLLDDGGEQDMVTEPTTATKAESCASSAQAGRLLSLFLTNAQDSPMLQLLHNDVGSDDDAVLAQVKNTTMQQLVRALIYLLDHRALFGRHKLMESHAFVLRCLQATPRLAQPFFRTLTIPELNRPFALISRWHLISKYVKRCNDFGRGGEGNQAHATVIWPDKLKHVLSKALQSSNAMVVAETLKLILHLIESCAQNDNTKQQPNESSNFSKKELDWNRLFELQVLISVRSRWDPFQRKKATPDLLITLHLCQVLDAVAKRWPRMLMTTKYDWVKLLPLTASVFSRSHPLLQMRMMLTLQTLMELQLDHDTNTRFTASSIRIVLEIMIDTKSKSPRVSRAAAHVVMLRFRRLLPNPRSDQNDEERIEVEACVEYEWECWLEGMTNEALPGFLTLVEHAATKKSSLIISAAVAWEKSGLPGTLPNLSLSSILLTALLDFPNENQPLALLTCQVAAKALLYHRFPLALAAIISSTHENECGNGCLSLLSQYAKSLVNFQDIDDAKRSQVLQSLVMSAFGNEAAHFLPQSGSDSMQWSRGIEKSRCIVAARQLMHLLVCTTDETECQRYYNAIRCLLLPAVGQREGNVGQVKPLIHYLYKILSEQHPCDTSFFDLALLSCPSSSALHGSLEKLKPFISSPQPLTEQSGALLSSKSSRINFLLNGLWKKLLPPSSASRATESLLQIFDDEKSNIPPVFEKMLVAWLSDVCPVASVNLDIGFRVWRNLCSRSTEFESSWQITRQLELTLCHSLESNPLASTRLFTLIQTDSPEDIIERCLRSKHALISKTSDDPGSCFLRAMLELDICCMMPIFMKKLNSANKSSVISKLFESTTLDCALILATEHLELLDASTRDSLTAKLITKIRASLSQKKKMSHKDKTTLMMIAKCLNNDNGSLEILDGFSEVIVSSMERFDKQDESMHSLILDAAECAIQRFSRLLGHDSVENGNRRWVAAVFTTLGNELPKVLRLFRRPDERENLISRGVVLQYLSLVQFVLSNQVELGLPWDKATALCVGNILRSCLKHGVTDELNDCDVTANCLRLVRLTLVESEKIRGSGDAVKFPSLSAPVVFRMTVTHSKFREAFQAKQERNDGDAPILELVLLLLCCVSLGNEISFDRTIWNALLSRFNAGVTPVDKTIRRLIHVYAQLAMESTKASCIFADEFNWSAALNGSDLEPSVSGVRASRWDWLLDALDSDRIRSTVQYFPDSDTLYPQPLEEEKKWPSRFEISTDATLVTADIEQDRRSQTKFHETSGLDMRYSPGFILPMILACMEYFFPGDDKLTESDLAESHPEELGRQGAETGAISDEIRAFVSTVKRLCDLGTLGFALGALCSKCSLVRKVSVAILSMMLKALRSREAASLQEWRERPQLLMLVNSVQRSLVIRKAAQVDDSSSDNSDVRRLPSVSAIFLARAAGVLSKPGDAMFSSINRFFLKVDAEHGAFQDLTRLPAFISLFCSSTDEPPGQAQKERVWALRLLEDGFLDESCYRLVTACHAPALLQTFLSTVRGPEREKDEKVNTLILRTLCRLLSNGGQHARTHLIGRMGLLSWLRCLLTEESIIISKEYVSALFLLVHLSVEGAIELTYVEKNDSRTLALEIIGLAQPIVVVAAEFFDSVKTTAADKEEKGTIEWLVDGIRKVLGSLKLAWAAVPTEIPLVRQDGISLHTAARVLKGVGLLDDQIAVLLPLCILPVRVDKSDFSAVAKFSHFALTTLHGARELLSNEHIQVVMNRIALLLQQSFETTPDEVRLPLCQELISCREICFRHEKGKQAWLHCMSKAAPGVAVDMRATLLELTRLLLNQTE